MTIHDKTISGKAFDALQECWGAQFPLTLAHKYCDRKYLAEARGKLQDALAKISGPAPRHVDYSEDLCIGGSSLQVGIDYRYDAGWPMRGPSLSGPGEPGEPASAEITGIYWRGAAPAEPWRAADDALAEMLIEAMGGEEAVHITLIQDAEGQAEAAAHDAAEARRDMWLEAGE